MNHRGHRAVAFAGEVVGVEWSGDRARHATKLAFGDRGSPDDRFPDVTFRLGTRADSQVCTLFEGRRCLYRGDSVGTAVHLLMQGALNSLISRSASGVVIHAALLGRGDHGVLLPGPTGSGKTMLCAWLTLRGLTYLSDEACYFAAGTAPMEGFARPLCFKGPWVELLGLEPVGPNGVLRDDGVSLVPPQLLKAACRRTAVMPRLIVFPHFQPNASFGMTRLTPGRATKRLLETVANTRNLTDLGVGQVTELTRDVAAYTLAYGRFDQLDPLLTLIASPG
ncbi:MAG TPA: hypothetical protein VN812_17625 [Candidatus Acidoferrales bacterium]|nr:hypothetical protein [Candidatus Acidoferrales bacterium]